MTPPSRTAADLTDEIKERLLAAALTPRGSEDDMFCSLWVPALLEALNEKTKP